MVTSVIEVLFSHASIIAIDDIEVKPAKDKIGTSQYASDPKAESIIVGVLPKDETSGQLQASTNNAM